MAQQKKQGNKMKKNKRGENLTYEDRVRGGKHSAAKQKRDEQGQFAGRVGDNMEDMDGMGTTQATGIDMRRTGGVMGGSDMDRGVMGDVVVERVAAMRIEKSNEDDEGDEDEDEELDTDKGDEDMDEDADNDGEVSKRTAERAGDPKWGRKKQ